MCLAQPIFMLVNIIAQFNIMVKTLKIHHKTIQEKHGFKNKNYKVVAQIKIVSCEVEGMASQMVKGAPLSIHMNSMTSIFSPALP